MFCANNVKTSAWQGQHQALGAKIDQKCLEISFLQTKVSVHEAIDIPQQMNPSLMTDHNIQEKSTGAKN